MSFLSPLIWLGAVGIALPILAHLLSRHRYKETKWAAMQFLNREVKVRSREIRLRDLFLLLLRCLALLLLVAALAKPGVKKDSVLGALGESRSGVVIAIDASYSMQHSDGEHTRFERAVQKVERIVADLHPGDPVSLILLAAEHRVLARNKAFDPQRFAGLLQALKAMPEALDVGSVPRHLHALVDAMNAPQKQLYLISDLQETDWHDQASPLRQMLSKLGPRVTTVLVPVSGGPENLAVTNLELISGVLRKGTTARYRASVRNYGSASVSDIVVKGVVNNATIDTKVIPKIAPGATETISLFIPFHNAGPARIRAELEADALLIDNVRRTVAVIRDRVSVLCVEESTGESAAFGGFVSAALRPEGGTAGRQDFRVETILWSNLQARDFSDYDVIVLADVPALTVEQAKQLDAFVRAGNGLIWFAGDAVKPAAWNVDAKVGGASLLPAEILGDAAAAGFGPGRPLDSQLSEHPVCKPLLSLTEDLLSEARFARILRVNPGPESRVVLSLAGNGDPLLLEHAVGRGQVFMFTSTVHPTWNNAALTPVFPMLLQQMVTYLTAREFETPHLVGQALTLAYEQMPDANDAVFDSPSGESLTVPVRKRRQQFVAVLDHAREAGFYEGKVDLQTVGMPIAVNVDTAESKVDCLPLSVLQERLRDADAVVAASDAALSEAIGNARSGSSLWLACLIMAVVLLLVESLLAAHRKESV